LKRSGPLRRNGPMRRSNPERRARALAEAFGDQAARCRASACCVPCCSAGPPCDPHHEPTRASGGRDADTVPLCRPHHEERHRTGVKTFQRAHGIDLLAIARGMSETL